MAMRELPGWLVKNEGFKRQLKNLTAQSVARQFASLVTDSGSWTEKVDASYMLTCASVLSHSDDGVCQDAALRIAQYCLESSDVSTERKDGALLVLDSLVNKAAIDLAVKRGMVDSEYQNRFPIVAQVDANRRKLQYTLGLSDQREILVNKFQFDFWGLAEKKSWLSVSAPTSVGKSFILEAWIEEFVSLRGNAAVIYLVPTRALITQVERDLKSAFATKVGVNISSIPLARSLVEDKHNIFVFTPERFHIFNNSLSSPLRVDLLLVDEAHKIGDGYRGVSLQKSIEMASISSPSIQVVFASPFTSNPEVLVEDAPHGKSGVLISNSVTVNQNLIWVSQKPRFPKQWGLSLCLPDEVVFLGGFSLDNTPAPDSKRLPFVALALSQGKPGNIVYVNGAADAEKAALQLYDAIGVDQAQDSEVEALIELCEKTIHKRFLLNRVLRRGIAFHYGNIPLLVKTEIERLFSLNKISFLVCTSTLVEGVNMSCKNIFMRGPKKGSRKLMGAEDFWNLAGRAGRWGREFQGNIFCVDADNSALWMDGAPPRNKRNVYISRTTDKVVADVTSLVEFILAPDHREKCSTNPEFEHVYNYLSATYVQFGSLRESPFMKRFPLDSVNLLEATVGLSLESVEVPGDIIVRNPGISPLLMQELLLRFSRPSEKAPDRFLLSDPSSDDALDSYVSAFSRIASHLSPKLGFSPRHCYVLALLVVRWMRGYPLSRLIAERISHFSRKSIKFQDANVIRDVMADVEEVARYHAPRLLSCYNDVLKYFLIREGLFDLSEQVNDVGVFLELGLSQQTQISLVSLGLSRTAAVMLSEFIAGDSLSEAECLAWLREYEWRRESFPELVKSEIQRVIDFAVFTG